MYYEVVSGRLGILLIEFNSTNIMSENFLKELLISWNDVKISVEFLGIMFNNLLTVRSIPDHRTPIIYIPECSLTTSFLNYVIYYGQCMYV